MYRNYTLRGSINNTQETLFMNISSNETFINLTSTIPELSRTADIDSDNVSYTYFHTIVTFGLVFFMIYLYVHIYYIPPTQLLYTCLKKALKK